MARARNIKPGIFRNEVLGVADPMYTLLFQGLWLLADRAGRLEDRPVRIKGDVFPYRDGVNVDPMLDWLQANGFIVRYQANGVRYIEVSKFAQHQNPHQNEPKSSIPSPSSAGPVAGAVGMTSEKIGSGSESVGSRTDGLGTAPADSLIPDSLINTSPTSSGEHAPKGTRTKKPRASRPTHEGFEEFYAAYPRKVDRIGAEAAWKKLAPDGALVARIVADVKKRAAGAEWQKNRGEYIPYPASYLNARRWEDEGVTLPDGPADVIDPHAERLRRETQRELQEERDREAAAEKEDTP